MTDDKDLNRAREENETDDDYYSRLADYYDSNEGAREIFDEIINGDEVYTHKGSRIRRGVYARFSGRILLAGAPMTLEHEDHLMQDRVLVETVGNLEDEDLKAFLRADFTYNDQISSLLHAVGVSEPIADN